MCGEWCVARYVVSGVWQDVWCLVSGVWCALCGV